MARVTEHVASWLWWNWLQLTNPVEAYYATRYQWKARHGSR